MLHRKRSSKDDLNASFDYKNNLMYSKGAPNRKESNQMNMLINTESFDGKKQHMFHTISHKQ